MVSQTETLDPKLAMTCLAVQRSASTRVWLRAMASNKANWPRPLARGRQRARQTNPISPVMCLSLPKGHPKRTPYGVTTNAPNKANLARSVPVRACMITPYGVTTNRGSTTRLRGPSVSNKANLPRPCMAGKSEARSSKPETNPKSKCAKQSQFRRGAIRMIYKCFVDKELYSLSLGAGLVDLDSAGGPGGTGAWSRASVTTAGSGRRG